MMMNRFSIGTAVACVAFASLACGKTGEARIHKTVKEAPAKSYGITPEDPASIKAGIEAAAKEGARKVRIPAGVYQMPKVDGSHWHLRLAGLKNMEIDATGVKLVFTARDQRAMLFEACSGVTFRGATLTRDVPPFSQGKVMAIADDRTWIDIRIDKGYPADLEDRRFFPRIPVINAYDPATRALKPGVPSLYTAATARGTDYTRGKNDCVERLGPDLFRFQMQRFRTSIPLAVGDPVAWRGTSGADLSVWECSGMRFEEVRIENGTGLGIGELYGNDNHWVRCSITYAEPPAGAVDRPLLACATDGFNSSAARRGPTLDHCFFEGLNDDAVNIHGNYALVMGGEGNTVVVDWREPHRAALSPIGVGRPGDELRIYDRRAALMDEAVIVSVKAKKDYVEVGTIPEISAAFRDRSKAAFYEVTLDRPVKVEPYGSAANANITGSGFVIRNCTFRNNRAHGIFIRASDGLIEGNTIEGTENAGIIIAPEMTAWPNEGDYARHIVIRRNTLRNVAMAPSQENSGLTIYGHEHGKLVPYPGGNRDIVIEENVFEKCPDSNLVITSSIGVKAVKNRFIKPMAGPVLHPSQVFNWNALINVRESGQVTLRDNVVVDPGESYKTAVDADSSVRELDAENAVSVQK